MLIVYFDPHVLIVVLLVTPFESDEPSSLGSLQL